MFIFCCFLIKRCRHLCASVASLSSSASFSGSFPIIIQSEAPGPHPQGGAGGGHKRIGQTTVQSTNFVFICYRFLLKMYGHQCGSKFAFVQFCLFFQWIFNDFQSKPPSPHPQGGGGGAQAHQRNNGSKQQFDIDFRLLSN